MNARIERVMNSENLGAKIMGNGGLDQKIWALIVLKGKMVISGHSGEFLESLEWLESPGAKNRGSYEVWNFF
jgi:hypothetical protein